MCGIAVAENLRRVAPEDIAPGDFTRFSGFRGVLDVTPVYITYGRGKNKVVDELTAVVLDRADGTQDRLPVGAFHPKTNEPMTYAVYRAAA